MAMAMVRHNTTVKATTHSLLTHRMGGHHPCTVILHSSRTMPTTVVHSNHTCLSTILNLAWLTVTPPTEFLIHPEMYQGEMDHHAAACAEDHLDVADAVLMRTCLGPLRKVPKVGT
jgi:hypothetical protein